MPNNGEELTLHHYENKEAWLPREYQWHFRWSGVSRTKCPEGRRKGMLNPANVNNMAAVNGVEACIGFHVLDAGSEQRGT